MRYEINKIEMRVKLYNNDKIFFIKNPLLIYDSMEYIIPKELNANLKDLKVLEVFSKKNKLILTQIKENRLLDVNYNDFKFFNIKDKNLLIHLIKICEYLNLKDIEEILCARISYEFC